MPFLYASTWGYLLIVITRDDISSWVDSIFAYFAYKNYLAGLYEYDDNKLIVEIKCTLNKNNRGSFNEFNMRHLFKINYNLFIQN